MVDLLLIELSNSMSWYTKILVILSKIFIVYGIYGISFLLFKSTKLINSYINIKKYQIDIMNTFTIEDANKILDTIIEDSLNNYMIMNGLLLKDYINEEQENAINKDICNIVASTISGILATKLSMFYDINSLSDIISRKVFVLTTSLTIEKNKNK